MAKLRASPADGAVKKVERSASYGADGLRESLAGLQRRRCSL